MNHRAGLLFISVTLGYERTFKILKVEELAGEGGDKGGGDPHIGTVTESGPEAHTLPLHTAVEGTVSSADGVVCLKEEAGADGVCSAGNEGGAGFEACDSILLDGKGMELCAETVALLLPILEGIEF